VLLKCTTTKFYALLRFLWATIISSVNENSNMTHIKISIQDIIDRMKIVVGVSMDKGLAEFFEGAPSSISAWKRRDTIPLVECLVLVERFGVTLDWLILGRGPRLASEVVGAVASGAESEAPIEPDTSACPVALRAYDLKNWEELDVDSWWSVPLNWLEREGLNVHETFMVRAWGDTMGGTIKNGQMVLVDRRPTDVDGVYLVEVGGMTRFKRIQHMVDGSVQLSSDNPMYATESVPDKSKLMVIGYCHAMVTLAK
jgi:hypothetical protein